MAARPEPVLYHFSHDGSIRLFVPRPSRLGEDFVWAVDDPHAWTYSVPRECPRASFWAQDGTSKADIDRFLDGETTRIEMVLEDRWMPEVESATLWRYILPPDTFVSHDGASISRSQAIEQLMGESLARREREVPPECEIASECEARRDREIAILNEMADVEAAEKKLS